MLIGAAGYAIARPASGSAVFGFDVHTLLYASLAIIAGQQAISFRSSPELATARVFAWIRARSLFEVATLERGIIAGQPRS